MSSEIEEEVIHSHAEFSRRYGRDKSRRFPTLSDTFRHFGRNRSVGTGRSEQVGRDYPALDVYSWKNNLQFPGRMLFCGRSSLKRKGAVLVTVIIIILVVSILSVGMIYTYTSNARLLEHQIRRTKATYAVMATLWNVIDHLMVNTPAYCPEANNCIFNPPNDVGGFDKNKITIHIYPKNVGAPAETRKIEITIDYG